MTSSSFEASMELVNHLPEAERAPEELELMARLAEVSGEISWPWTGEIRWSSTEEIGRAEIDKVMHDSILAKGGR
jgi:hypothetical protein